MKIKLAIWLFNNVRLPSWALPWVFGAIIGRVPHKVEEENKDD